MFFWSYQQQQKGVRVKEKGKGEKKEKGKWGTKKVKWENGKMGKKKEQKKSLNYNNPRLSEKKNLVVQNHFVSCLYPTK